MIRPNLRSWTYTEDLEGLLFFAQAIHEMLFDYTIDSYKSPALNTHTLCWELLHIINSYEDLKYPTIVPMIEELRYNLKHDFVAKNILKSRYEFLEHRLASSNDIKSAFDAVKMISIHLDDTYLDAVKTAIIETVSKPKKKRELYYLARTFITELLNRGYSKSHLYFTHKEYFFRRDINSIEAIRPYLDSFAATNHKWEVVFLGNKDFLFVKDAAKSIGVNISEEIVRKFPDNKYEEAFYKDRGANLVSLSCNVKAYDCYQAARRAESHIDKIMSVVNFYSHNKEQIYKRRSLVYSQDDIVHILGSPTNPMHKRPNEVVGEDAKYIGLLLFSLGLANNNFNKIWTAMNLHATSSQTTDAGNQLLNLWSAIEGVFPVPKDAKSRIGHFLKCMVPIIRQDYCSKIVKNLYTDIDACSEFIKVREEYKDLSKFTELITLKSKEPDLEVLLADVGINPLLRYRIFTVHNHLVSADSISQFIEAHCHRINWQIQRIYRSRNFIVHAGDKLPYIEVLVENLHNYFDTILTYFAEVLAGGVNISKVYDVVDKAIMEVCLHESLLKSGKGRDCSSNNYEELLFGAR